MAKFNVGDMVQCAELNIENDCASVEACSGVIIEIDQEEGDHCYLVKVDIIATRADDDEWWYSESQLSPIPTSRTTTIEWFTPDERLPREDSKVLFITPCEMLSGEFYGGGFSAYGEWWQNVRDVKFWAYAPEVK